MNLMFYNSLTHLFFFVKKPAVDKATKLPAIKNTNQSLESQSNIFV